MARPHLNDEELAEMQKLSNEFEAPVTGPLVAHRQPAAALVTEFASADPIYQAKTAALAQKYTHYRSVRGDGKCGWRAAAFGYFEALIRLYIGQKFAEEEARLRGLAAVVAEAGFDPALFEDFAEETFELLQKVAQAVAASPATAHASPMALHHEHAENVLLDAFNDDTLQNYIITHLRTLTAGWMKTHEADYAPWLLGQTVQQYVDGTILPVAAEIDHVGLTALKDVLLSPAGIALEVLYLDRSAGGEVTMHRFDPVNAMGTVIGSVRLLYRPGHYDLLYRREDLPPPISIVTPTYLQYSSEPHYDPIYDPTFSDHVARIPGFSLIPSSSVDYPSAFVHSSNLFLDHPSELQPQPREQKQPIGATPAPVPPYSTVHHHPQHIAYHLEPRRVPSSPELLPSELFTPIEETPPVLQYELPFRNNPPPPHDMAAPALSGEGLHFAADEGPFRPSAWQFRSSLIHATSQPFRQGSMLRDSHFNRAHFRNPNFQPELWDPSGDYIVTSYIPRSYRYRTARDR